MQQRRLRLGDIVDDYCPRERRITNHAVVAMIDDEVKQTRCTTCDADHPYRKARVPPQRRRKEAPGVAAAEALAAMPRRSPADDPSSQPALDDDAPFDAPLDDVEPAAEEGAQTAEATAEEAGEERAPLDDDGPVHRPLFRAKLPRPEGHVPERKLPEFTIHQRDLSGNRGRARRGHRPGQMRVHGNGQPTRFGGPRQGQGGGHGKRQAAGRPGQRSGPGQPGQQRQPRHGGGRKRGR